MAENQAVVSVPNLLLKHGLVTREALNEANKRKREEDKTLGRILYEMQAVDETRKLDLFKHHFGLEVVSLADFKIDAADLGALPRSFCERNCVVPILRERHSLVLAVEDPTNVVVIDEAASLSGMTIHPVIASCKDIVTALEQYPEKPAEEEVDVAALERQRRSRQLHYILFFLVTILPIPLSFVLIWQIEVLQQFLRDMERYETILVSFLVWALWGALVYEVDGLLIKRTREAR